MRNTTINPLPNGTGYHIVSEIRGRRCESTHHGMTWYEAVRSHRGLFDLLYGIVDGDYAKEDVCGGTV